MLGSNQRLHPVQVEVPRLPDYLFLMLFGMFIPYQSVLIPLTQTLAFIGLGGTLWGLILVHVVYGIPITTLIFRNYYAEVPTELIEAAASTALACWAFIAGSCFPSHCPGSSSSSSAVHQHLERVPVCGFDPAAARDAADHRRPAQPVGQPDQRMEHCYGRTLIAAIPTLLIYIILGRYFIRACWPVRSKASLRPSLLQGGKLGVTAVMCSPTGGRGRSILKEFYP